MRPSSITFLLFLLAAAATQAQPLSEVDFAADSLILWRPIKSALHLLPNPKSITVEDVPQTGGRFLVDSVWKDVPPEKQYFYTFDSLIVRTNGFGLIDRFEFTLHTLATHRGIRIGDSIDLVRSKYGEPSGEGYLGDPRYPEDGMLSYFEDDSVMGIAFMLRNGRVFRIIIGSGTT